MRSFVVFLKNYYSNSETLKKWIYPLFFLLILYFIAVTFFLVNESSVNKAYDYITPEIIKNEVEMLAVDANNAQADLKRQIKTVMKMKSSHAVTDREFNTFVYSHPNDSHVIDYVRKKNMVEMGLRIYANSIIHGTKFSELTLKSDERKHKELISKLINHILDVSPPNTYPPGHKITTNEFGVFVANHPKDSLVAVLIESKYIIESEKEMLKNWNEVKMSHSSKKGSDKEIVAVGLLGLTVCFFLSLIFFPVVIFLNLEKIAKK